MLSAIALVLAATPALPPPTLFEVGRQAEPPGLGACLVHDPNQPPRPFPLEKTTVNAEIAGFGARVTLVQTFRNPERRAVEAVYAFPLPADAAVDRMRMRVDNRIIVGTVMKRAEARQVYETARNNGQVASLLDQERPNLFTQHVANVPAGSQVEIEISYVQFVKYEEGQFEFSLPLRLGERYITSDTRDAARVGQGQVGGSVELTAWIDAGAPIQTLTAPLQNVQVQRQGDRRAVVRYAAPQLPESDFIVRYEVARDSVQTGLLTHWDEQHGGFFALILLPPKVAQAAQVAPREVLFVMDQSGSQRGFPIERSRELTIKMIEELGPNDTFNVFGFSNHVTRLWAQPQPNTAAMRAEAIEHVRAMEADGGTEFLKAVLAALERPSDQQRVRLLVFNTDGLVGNDLQILDAVRNDRNGAATRMFTFGIGNTVNRFLIESLAAEGQGDYEIITKADQAKPAVERFLRRTRQPILTNIQVHSAGNAITGVFPEQQPDLFSEKPLVIMGRYAKPGRAVMSVSGNLGGERWIREIELDLSDRERQASSIMSIWARRKVQELMRLNWAAQLPGSHPLEYGVDEIIKTAIQFQIVTQHTSFVAVDEQVARQVASGTLPPDRIPEGLALITADPHDNSIVMSGGTAAMSMAPRSQTSEDFARMRRSGLLQGYPEGLFRGGRPSTRYEEAVAVSATVKNLSEVYKKLEQQYQEIDRQFREFEAKEAAYLAGLSPADRRQWRYETRVPSALRQVQSGEVKIFVWLTRLTPEAVRELAGLGLKVEGQVPGVHLVLGTIAVRDLEKLAQHSVVRLIHED
jgi:Ca-activated chloride channel homolog